MREITEIIIHCSYTPVSMDIGAAEIDQWHRDRGWKMIGYHRVIRRDGLIEKGRPLKKVGAHAKGHNANSLGICLVGGMNDAGTKVECNFTRLQWVSLSSMYDKWSERFPGARWLGHREVSHKSCPAFDVQKWLGLMEKEG